MAVSYTHLETFDYGDAKVFTVEFLPGQFDQRAASAEQCVKLLNENEEPIIRSAITYVIEGAITCLLYTSVEIVRKGKVRRAKLYYLRDRIGKAAKVKELVK